MAAQEVRMRNGGVKPDRSACFYSLLASPMINFTLMQPALLPWLLMGGLLFPLVYLAVWPRLSVPVLKDLRLPRILHYVSLASIGGALHLRTVDRLTTWLRSETVWLMPVFIVCLAWAAVFAIVTNNLADVETDRISNPGRPLVTGAVRKRPYLLAGIHCLFVAMGLSFLAHPLMGGCITAISFIYFVYSCPPLRLKRIPIVSKLLIGLNSLLVAVAGFALTGGEAQDFPLWWALFILIPLSLAANFVDLKDTAGDRAAQVATLPVLLGEQRARHFIAGCTLSAYVTGAWLLQLAWLWPLSLGMAAAHLWFLYRQPYDERPVFLVYVSSLFGIAFFLFFSPASYG